MHFIAQFEMLADRGCLFQGRLGAEVQGFQLVLTKNAVDCPLQEQLLLEDEGNVQLLVHFFNIPVVLLSLLPPTLAAAQLISQALNPGR